MADEAESRSETGAKQEDTREIVLSRYFDARRFLSGENPRIGNPCYDFSLEDFLGKEGGESHVLGYIGFVNDEDLSFTRKEPTGSRCHPVVRVIRSGDPDQFNLAKRVPAHFYDYEQVSGGKVVVGEMDNKNDQRVVVDRKTGEVVDLTKLA
jgi:hypothetical protein